MPADGACLFSSLACAINNLGAGLQSRTQDSDEWNCSKRDASALRTLVCNTLSKKAGITICPCEPALGTHLEYVMGDFMQIAGNSSLPKGHKEWSDMASYKFYVERMRKTMTWGTGLEMWVVAVLFNICVKVYEDGNEKKLDGSPETYRLIQTCNVRARALTACLRYVGGRQRGVHYELLVVGHIVQPGRDLEGLALHSLLPCPYPSSSLLSLFTAFLRMS